MARPKNLRRINNPPKFKGYTPSGHTEILNPEIVIINLEEYEAIRLCDYENYSQEQASKQMNVSRPTFTRIYATARSKVAEAFAEGKSIVFEGGKIFLNSDWYSCKNCKSMFNNYTHTEIPSCTLCGSVDISPV